MSRVHLGINRRVAELRLDTPAKLNAFTVEMLGQFAGHLDTIERSGDIACVLVTAAEAKAFCAGADIDGWGDLTPAEFARHRVRGGKNPQVISSDADLDSAADAAVFGACFNVGQCCNSSSRIIVHEDIARDFLACVVELSRHVRCGDPLDPDTQVGAIVTPEHGANIHGLVAAAAAEGAQFYRPTVVTGVTPDGASRGRRCSARSCRS